MREYHVLKVQQCYHSPSFLSRGGAYTYCSGQWEHVLWEGGHLPVVAQGVDIEAICLKLTL